MTKAFKAGDRVTVARKDDETCWTYGLTGTVVMQRSSKDTWRREGDLDMLVEFSKEDSNGEGHDDKADDNRTTRWWITSDNLDPSDDVLTLGETEEFTTKHFRAGSQSSRILAHLLSGKSITNGECRLVYGDWRLSDIIFKIREAGFEVNTTIKEDAVGHKYASYTLAAKAA